MHDLSTAAATRTINITRWQCGYTGTRVGEAEHQAPTEQAETVNSQAEMECGTVRTTHVRTVLCAQPEQQRPKITSVLGRGSDDSYHANSAESRCLKGKRTQSMGVTALTSHAMHSGLRQAMEQAQAVRTRKDLRSNTPMKV